MIKAPSSQPSLDLFGIPGPAVARHPGVLLAPRELRRWLDTLPLGNPPNAAQMLLQQLRLLVRDPQPESRLVSLLQMYDAPVDRLLEVVDERLQGNTTSALPLDQLEYVLVELLSELAFGYLRAANDLLVRSKQPPAETLYRAMRLLDDAMAIQRQHYCRIVPEGWRLFTRIYRHAESQQISRQPVDAKLRRAGQPATIEALFFRALLISLCDPHHYRPDQILAWHRWTTGHTDLLELGILPQGAFSIPVDLSGELAPLTGARRGKPGPDMRYLLTDGFLQRLQDDAGAPAALGQALIGLIKGRKSSEQRQSPRQPRNHPFLLMYGLRNIHARLDALTRGSAGGSTPSAAIACRQVNQSKSGAAFHLQGPLNPPLNVGEPILVETASPPQGGAPVGFAGRIRRVVTLDGQQIEIGVEKLQGRLVPLVVTGAAAERLHGSNQALLQQVLDSGQYTLLAPRTLYREGDRLTAESATAELNLRIKRLLGVVQHTAFIDVELTQD